MVLTYLFALQTNIYAVFLFEINFLRVLTFSLIHQNRSDFLTLFTLYDEIGNKLYDLKRMNTYFLYTVVRSCAFGGRQYICSSFYL